MTVIWYDGALREPSEPLVSALDHGFTVGDGVFETCSVIDGKAFALTRHLARLARSATGLGLDAPDNDAVLEGVAQVLAHAPADTGRMRITLTAGLGPLGSPRDAATPTLIVAAGPASPRPVARVLRVDWVRNERSAVAGLKTTSYAENVVALAAAMKIGADEALMANTVGELCEGTGSNVFIEHDGELLTPPLSSGCLAGITRELLLEWGAAAHLPIREAAPGELRFSDLDAVARGEAHLTLTGSVRNVVPVVAMDGKPITPGPVGLAACTLFDQKMRALIDP